MTAWSSSASRSRWPPRSVSCPRSWTPTTGCASWSPRNWPRWPAGTAPPAAPSCWRTTARPGRQGCRWRWRTTRARCCCRRRACWPGLRRAALACRARRTMRDRAPGRLAAADPAAEPPGLSGGAPATEFVATEPGETVVALVAPDAAGAGLALGTMNGVVKRVAPDYPQSAAEFEVIALRDGDRVVGAVQLESDDADLVFITSDAQLLRFPAAAVRPQGRAAGGMAGIRLAAGASVIWFGAVRPGGPGGAAWPQGPGPGEPVVVTVAGSAGALPGAMAASVKVTPYSQYPAKGRATGGVRCHRFLKGEDALVLAWAGPGPALGATAAGTPVPLPPPAGRRDGSGEKVTQPLAAVGGAAPPG